MITIVPATPAHVGIISCRLRAGDCAEILALYGDARKAIRGCFRVSVIRRTAFVGDEIAAMWGATGTLLSCEGNVWLVTTPAIESVPLGFFRECRRELREMMETRDTLRGLVAAEYHKAVRFMEMLGFSASKPFVAGPGQVKFRELVLRRGEF